MGKCITPECENDGRLVGKRKLQVNYCKECHEKWLTKTAQTGADLFSALKSLQKQNPKPSK